MEKEGFKKNSQKLFKKSGTNRECMDSLFVKCLNDLSWKWLMQGDLKVQTEATVCAAQDQALRANYTKSKIDKTSANP